jgi:competence protein ComEC
MAAGILLQDRVVVPLTLWPALAGATAAIALLHARRTQSRPLQLALWAALSCLCLGAVRMAYAERVDPHDVRQILPAGPRLATLRGRVVRDIRIGERDWVFKVLHSEDPGTRFYVQTSGVQTTQGWRRVHGTVGVWVGEPIDDLQIGDEIQMCGWLERLTPPTNPGQFDIASYLLDQGVVAAATLKSRQGIEKRPPSSLGSALRWVYSMRHRTCLALACHWPDDPRSLGLVQALVLGVRADVQNDVSEAFYRTGLLHYVSLSGMHFAILVGVVWFLARVAGLLRPAAAAVCSAAVGLFVLLIPAMAPAMRAAILCWVFCAGVLVRRQGHGVNTLALAALLLLLARPSYLLDPSWQLSFACMAGIFLLSGPIEKAVREGWRLVQPAGNRLADGGRPPPVPLWLRKGAEAILPLLCVGFGAWLASAGIVLYHFYNLTPLAPVWTVLVFPAVWVVMVLGVVKVLASLVLHGLCPVTAWTLAAATRVLIWAVDQLGHVDVSSVRVGHISTVPILLYYGLLATVLLIDVRRRPLWRATVVAVACVTLAWVGWTKWQHTHRCDLIMTCLDVGHGQAIVVQPPGSGALLLDAGSRVKADVGTRIVNPRRPLILTRQGRFCVSIRVGLSYTA